MWDILKAVGKDLFAEEDTRERESEREIGRERE